MSTASVVIVNWNGEKFLERCLNSLLAQTVKPREIIFIDNASTDRSLEVVARYPAVRLIAQKQNTGFAYANNLAVESTTNDTEWIALLNPDAFAEPGWLESLLDAAKKNRGYDVFGSTLISAADPNILDGIGDTYHLSGLAWRMGQGRHVDSDTKLNEEIFSPCAAAALYRRSAFLAVGGFDTDFFCYLEDVDLGFRLRLAGYKAMQVTSSVAHHVGSGTTGGQHSDFSIYHGHRNLVWTFVKNMPSALFWPLLPLHLLLNFIAIVWFAACGKGRVILRAKLDAARGLPAMWRKRQRIQSMRVAPIGAIWRILNKRLVRFSK
jgi:GT2 family glycosyltransferase